MTNLNKDNPIIVDYHTLDTCDCGGKMDHWKIFYPEDQYYVASWLCRKCDHYDCNTESIEENNGWIPNLKDDINFND